MITTLRESKAKLSELVERASQGEDILITVRGKVKAKLTKAPEQKQLDMAEWAEILEQRQRKHGKANVKGKKPKMTMQEILDETREDRF
ncbi:MAG: type II toxin-antitoxin system Phd/YefM family antitoxin [Trueperaceae bacterium]